MTFDSWRLSPGSSNLFAIQSQSCCISAAAGLRGAYSHTPRPTILPKPESTEGRPWGQPLKKPECIRAGLYSGNHQSSLRRLDRGLRLGAPHRRAAGPAHPPRPHPGDERRKLQAQAQQRERRVPSSRRSRGRIGRTVNAVSTCSFNVPTPTNLLPSVITSVVHDHAAPVAQYLSAIDKQGTDGIVD